MQIQDVKQELLSIKKKFEDIFSMIDYEALTEEIKVLDQITFEQGFWDNQEQAQSVIKKVKILKNRHEKLSTFKTLYDDALQYGEWLKDDESLLGEFEETVKKLTTLFDNLSIQLLLSDDFDSSNAVLEIHPGAGGTESQDWADMLFRMFRRFSEQQEMTFEVLDYLAGDEAGIKSVTFSIKGDYAYGYLKSEHGVHRLVRISPFDSGGRRHTSFASINVIPEIDENIKVEINEKDLKIDTYRSSGAGGQSVNTTDSAVRITHLPTKTVVTVQNERSQIKNRETAMNILKSKLYQIELEKKKSEISSFRSTSVSNSFGSQIRSYVMHPYSMVKDHRTNEETGNVAKVLDGDIQRFLNAYLKMNALGEQND